MPSKLHPGFKAEQAKIAKQKGRNGKPLGMKAAGAILAKGADKASAKAVKTNPRLKRVRDKDK